MGKRKWEELSMDCLANVFGRVGMESLILDVPFVCKSWYKATLNPLCWKDLVFPNISQDPWCFGDDPFTSRLMDEYQVGGNFSVTAFIKFVIDRSHGSATRILLPSDCTEEALVYVTDQCPELKILWLPNNLPNYRILKIPNLTSKWKNLEHLGLRSASDMREILAQISFHCKNLVSLAVRWANIHEDEASALITLLPNIKYLQLRRAHIDRDVLVMILQGCKQLVYFDVSNSVGFEGDDEILKLASHINTFKYEGSRLDDWENYEYTINYRDDGFHDGNISD